MTEKVLTGRVVQVIGPVVDVTFESDRLPELLDAVHLTNQAGDRVVPEGQQHTGNGTVQPIATESTDGRAGGSGSPRPAASRPSRDIGRTKSGPRIWPGTAGRRAGAAAGSSVPAHGSRYRPAGARSQSGRPMASRRQRRSTFRLSR